VIRRLLLFVTFMVASAFLLVSSFVFADDLSPNQFIEQVISVHSIAKTWPTIRENFIIPIHALLADR
jgi:hypothetical protein